MEPVQKKYIVDEQGRRVGVQVDVAVFEKMEALLENYALFQLMKNVEEEEALDLEAAKAYYAALPRDG